MKDKELFAGRSADSLLAEVEHSMLLAGFSLEDGERAKLNACLKARAEFDDAVHVAAARLPKSARRTTAYGTVSKDLLDNPDPAERLAAEREIVSLRMAEILAAPVHGYLTLPHLQKIHQWMFGDLYDWAGNLRHNDAACSGTYCPALYLEDCVKKLLADLKQERYLMDCTDEKIAERLAYYWNEFYVLHPFPWGNGRTQRVLFQYLGAIAGYRIDFQAVSLEEFAAVAAEAFACRGEKAATLFCRVMRKLSDGERKASVAALFGAQSAETKWLQGRY